MFCEEYPQLSASLKVSPREFDHAHMIAWLFDEILCTSLDHSAASLYTTLLSRSRIQLCSTFRMRRVSSRQRLVSWDRFDAAAPDSDEEQDDFVTCYEASLSRNSSFGALEDTGIHPLLAVDTTIQPLSRKREREPSMKKNVSFSDLLPVVISAHASEVVDDEEDETHHSGLTKELVKKPAILLLPLDSLIQDVQLHILSFLTVAEAKNMALVSKQYRSLLHSQEAMTVWTEWFQRRWPNQSTVNVEFVDLLQLPTVLVETPATPNMAVLMGMAARQYPAHIDKSLQVPPTLSRLRRFSHSPARTMFRTFIGENGREVTQYLGPIGTGDRCIRANEPLARPERLGRWSPFSNNVSIFNEL